MHTKYSGAYTWLTNVKIIESEKLIQYTNDQNLYVFIIEYRQF